METETVIEYLYRVVRTPKIKKIDLITYFFTEFTKATRITGGLSKHRQKPYNAYYPYN